MDFILEIENTPIDGKYNFQIISEGIVFKLGQDTQEQIDNYYAKMYQGCIISKVDTLTSITKGD